MFKLNDKVTVQMGDWKFESEIMDIAGRGVWVDHPELKGEDWLFIDLTKPTNKVEIAKVESEIQTYENENIKEIKRNIKDAIKYFDEEDEVSVAVKIYDCYDSRSHDGFGQTYDVEIMLYINDKYEDSWSNSTFASKIEGDAEALKPAKKRANAVLRTVKGWFKYDDEVTVEDGVEVYRT